MFALQLRQPPEPTGWRGRLRYPFGYSRPNHRNAGGNNPYLNYGPGFFSGENLHQQPGQQARQARQVQQAQQAQPGRCSVCQTGCDCGHACLIPFYDARGRHPTNMAPRCVVRRPHEPHAIVPRPSSTRSGPLHGHHFGPRIQLMPTFSDDREPRRHIPRAPARSHRRTMTPSSRYDGSEDEVSMHDPFYLSDFDERYFSSDDESSLGGMQRRGRSPSFSSDSSASTSGWSMVHRLRPRRRPVDFDDAVSWNRERGNARWFCPPWRT